MFSFVWWIIGFYWVSSGTQALANDSPQLYWFVLPISSSHSICLYRMHLLLHAAFFNDSPIGNSAVILPLVPLTKLTCFAGYAFFTWLLMFSLSFSALHWRALLALLFAVVFRVSLLFFMQLQTR